MSDNDEITVCAGCGKPVKQLWEGNEGWTWCDSCQTIEPRTKCMTLKEWEAEQK